MKKIVLYICLLLLVFTFHACEKTLNIKPENIIQDENIYTNESGVEAYIASMYNMLPVEDFNFRPTLLSYTQWAHLTDEALNAFNYDAAHLGNGVSAPYWQYQGVRVVNDFLIKLPAAKFSQEKINAWLGEAKFIRAYYYFGMVKRYGGIPLITDVQSFTGDNLAELQVPRNTEKEVYDFIAKELDEAAALLSPVVANKSRANKYIAYALKSRTMLYAASIAKYGAVQLNGLVGIPVEDANYYWQAAYDAAKKIMDDNKYSLYNKQTDKSENFTALFLDFNNPEVIFAEYFKLPEKGHSYDVAAVPLSGRGSASYSSLIGPTVEIVEQFEYINEASGKLKLTDGGGNPIKYTNPSDLFKDKDPRLAATVILPFSKWRGDTIKVQAGLIHNGVTITTGNYNSLYDSSTKTIGAKGMRIIGADGIGGALVISQTGFYIRKYLNPNYGPAQVVNLGSDQQYIDIRFAEILLNYAEAAVELGYIPDAKLAMNQVRERAGISLLQDVDVTSDRVRRERTVELAFENHRYWDLRRWRIGPNVVPPNTKFKAIMPYKVLDDNTYIFKTGPVGYAKTWSQTINYEKITPGEITKNPNLIQNPFY